MAESWRGPEVMVKQARKGTSQIPALQWAFLWARLKRLWEGRIQESFLMVGKD